MYSTAQFISMSTSRFFKKQNLKISVKKSLKKNSLLGLLGGLVFSSLPFESVQAISINTGTGGLDMQEQVAPLPEAAIDTPNTNWKTGT